MLTNGIIGFSDSEWATVPVFAKKKPDPVTRKSELRTAIDFRGINQHLCADRLTMPHMEDVFESLSEASRYSTFDICAGFWGIAVRKSDQKYLSFHGFWKGAWHLFKFLRMSFGLKCATADFSRCYQRILGPTLLDPRGLLNKICRVWVDDAVIYSGNTSDHLDDVTQVFQRFIANGMRIKPTKCVWNTTRLPFLGHLVVAGAGVRPDSEKIKDMLEAKPPDDVADLRTFNGQTAWMWKHVEDYTALIKPLRDIVNRYPRKTRADISHIWMEEPAALKAFNAVKTALCYEPLLSFPKFDRCFIVCVDASGAGYGAVLCQLDDEGDEKPIAYASCALNDAQKKYSIAQAESAAMMFALRKWRTYIQGSAYTTVVVTDNNAVCSLVAPGKHFSNRRLATYAAELGDLDIATAHRSGRIHFTPDWLSRCKLEEDEEALTELYSNIMGRVAQLAHQISTRKQRLLFDPEVQAARLTRQAWSMSSERLALKFTQCMNS